MEQDTRGVNSTPYKHTKKFEEIISSQKFKESIESKVKLLVSGDSIRFSDLVTVFACIPCLVYEEGFFIADYENGQLMDLNEGEKQHLDRVREYINCTLYSGVAVSLETGFFSLNITHYTNEDGEIYEKLHLEKTPIPTGIVEKVVGNMNGII